MQMHKKTTHRTAANPGALVLLICLTFLVMVSTASAGIIDQPEDQRVFEGQRAAFSIVATGDNPQFQWQRDDTAIPGATAASYNLENVQLNDDGSWFKNRVTTAADIETSLEAQLVVFNKGDLDRNGEINKDDLAILRHYKRKDGEQCEECDLNDDGRIDRRDRKLLKKLCTNDHCRRSEPNPPIIIRQPETQFVTEGHAVKFEVKIFPPGHDEDDRHEHENRKKDKHDKRGKHEDKDRDDDDRHDDDDEHQRWNITYQWQKDGVDIAGATRPVLRLKEVPLEDDGSRIRCRITYDSGSFFSRQARLFVHRKIDLSWFRFLNREDLKHFKHELNLDEILELYEKGHDDKHDGNDDRQGRKKKDRHKRHDDKEGNGEHREHDKSKCELTWPDQPLIFRQPFSRSVSEGGKVEFAVRALGKRLRYQWQKDGVDIPEADKRELHLKEIPLVDSGSRFRCVIMDKDYNEIASAEVELTVYPQADYDWDGNIDKYDVNVLRYYLGKRGNAFWQYDFDGDGFISLNDLRILMDQCHCPRCQEPVLPTITEQPSDATVIEGHPVTFSVAATSIGRKFTFQWQENGVDIPGATRATYTIVPDLYDHWKTYRCVVTNVMGSVTSAGATLEVEMDVPPNSEPVTNSGADWQRDHALLTWDRLEGYRYQIHRGSKVDQIALLTEVDEPPYLDETAEYYFGWYYRLATIKDYFHPVSGKAYHSVGPLSDPIYLEAQPSPKVNILDTMVEADGTFARYFDPDQTQVEGYYETMEGTVNITAVLGAETVTAVSDSGNFILTLDSAGTWQIDFAEVDGWRSASVILDLKVDSDKPMLIVSGADQRTTSDSFIELTGRAADEQSGLKSVTVNSDRYADQEFGALVDGNGDFTANLPLAVGDNQFTVIAKDRYGNETKHVINVACVLPSLPQITIFNPENGVTAETPQVDLNGMVRSSLPPEQIRLVFENQVYFPAGTQGDYSFSIPGVQLSEGANTLEIRAESPYGSVSAQTTVYYQTEDGQQQDPDDPTIDGQEQHPPVIEVLSPLPGRYLTDSAFVVSGFARSAGGIAEVKVNGTPAAITGAGESYSFTAALNFNGNTEQPVTVEAADNNGLTSSVEYRVFFDDVPPVITLDNLDLQLSPAVNSVLETPYPLSGIIIDANPAGVAINDQPLHLLPGAQNEYGFDAQVELVRGEERQLLLSAWDMAGNRTDFEIILRHDAGLDIEIISPRPGNEYTIAGDSVPVEVTLRIPGLAADDQVSVTVDGIPVNGLTREASTVHGAASVPTIDYAHDLTAEVYNAGGSLLARSAVDFTVVDLNTVPLALEWQEPENAATGVDTNGFLALYFNKPIDPALLQVEMRETAHGLDYIHPDNGADISEQSKVELGEVHRDREIVPGDLAHFPEKTMSAFYPDRTLAFGATEYVTVSYDGEELAASSFKTRPLPTFIQGFVADQFRQPLQGITVSIPDLKRTAVTDKEGSFTFGMGEAADKAIPAGRYPAIANPGLANRSFGSAQFLISVEGGRLNTAGLVPIPVLNPAEPFRHIASGEAQAILASGELTLDLSEATLGFAAGGDAGNVHTQFMEVTQIPYIYRPSAMPQWVFMSNPGGIAVSGKVGLTFKMPAMFGSHDYIDRVGDRVVLIGLDPDSLQLVPVGVGKIDTAARQVTSEGKVQLKRLDCLAYGLVDEDKQVFLESYAAGGMSLSELTMKLEE